MTDIQNPSAVGNQTANMKEVSEAAGVVDALPEFRLRKNQDDSFPKVKVEVIKSTARDTSNGEMAAFNTKMREVIKGQSIPGTPLVTASRVKHWYLWTETAVEEGAKFDLDFSHFVIRRVDEEWVNEEGEDMETTRDVLQLRQDHPSGL